MAAPQALGFVQRWVGSPQALGDAVVQGHSQHGAANVGGGEEFQAPRAEVHVAHAAHLKHVALKGQMQAHVDQRHRAEAGEQAKSQHNMDVHAMLAQQPSGARGTGHAVAVAAMKNILLKSSCGACPATSKR